MPRPVLLTPPDVSTLSRRLNLPLSGISTCSPRGALFAHILFSSVILTEQVVYTESFNTLRQASDLNVFDAIPSNATLSLPIPSRRSHTIHVGTAVRRVYVIPATKRVLFPCKEGFFAQSRSSFFRLMMTKRNNHESAFY